MLAAPLAPPASRPGCLRILLADDNEVLRRAVQGLLRSLGHRVEVVTNGQEAVEQAGRVDYDVIFLDIQMPEMGGFEAAAMLRGGRADGRPWLVALSADGEGLAASHEAGLDDFAAKPIRLDDLQRILRGGFRRGPGPSTA